MDGALSLGLPAGNGKMQNFQDILQLQDIAGRAPHFRELRDGNDTQAGQVLRGLLCLYT